MSNESQHAERRGLAVDLRRGGASYRQIAGHLAVSVSTAYGYVQDALAVTAEHTAEHISTLRAMENERLDAIQVALWPERGDPKHATALIALSRRRAAINGLDAPKQIEVGGDLGLHGDKLAPHLGDLSQLEVEAISYLLLVALEGRDHADRAPEGTGLAEQIRGLRGVSE